MDDLLRHVPELEDLPSERVPFFGHYSMGVSSLGFRGLIRIVGRSNTRQFGVTLIGLGSPGILICTDG